MKAQDVNSRATQTGFTVVELVVVITLIGIMSAVGTSRFANQQSFEERGLFDDTRMAVRYAQKLAVGTGCEVQVSFDSSIGYALTQRATSCAAGAYTRGVRNPGKGTGSFASSTTSGISYSAAATSISSGLLAVSAVRFNALGQAQALDSSATLINDTSRITVSVGSRKMIVETETGFVCGPIGDDGCV